MYSVHSTKHADGVPSRGIFCLLSSANGSAWPPLRPAAVNGGTATRSRGEQARKWNVEQRDPVLLVERMTDSCVFPVAHLNIGMWDFQTWQGS